VITSIVINRIKLMGSSDTVTTVASVTSTGGAFRFIAKKEKEPHGR